MPLESKAAIDGIVAAQAKRIDAERKQLSKIDAQVENLSELELRGELDAAGRANLDRLERGRNRIFPSWLAFEGRTEPQGSQSSAANLAERSRPKVVLRYDNGSAFLVERETGLGQVVLITTGFLSDWNDLPRKNAVWLIDRILRSRIEATLPQRNVDTSTAPILIPILSSQRNEPFVLMRPNGLERPLEVLRRGPNDFAVAVSDFAQRGIYRVGVHRAADHDHSPSNGEVAAVIAANGPSEESKLVSIDEHSLAVKLNDANGLNSATSHAPSNASGLSLATRYRWVARDQTISLSGANVWGQDAWRWLLLIALGCLLAELAILAWPVASRSLAARRKAAQC